MKPRSRQKSASPPDADLNRQINSATVAHPSRIIHKVGAPRRLSHIPINSYTTLIPGNPPECLRRDPRRDRSAPVGLPAIQDGEPPLNCAGSSTDVKMSPSCRSDGGARTLVCAPMNDRATGNPSCRCTRIQNGRGQLKNGSIHKFPISRNPAKCHECCLNGGCHGH
jgi:hypothetical protein